MFIHEMQRWPDFTWDGKQIAVKLGEVRYRQGKILGQMQVLGFEIREETMLDTLTLDVLKSNEIEGKILNAAQVRSSVAIHLGIDIAGAVKTDRELDGVVEMMLDATQDYHTPLTLARLFGWHGALFPKGWSGWKEIKVAEWRDSSMEVVSGAMGKEIIHFTAPDAKLVPAEMKRFLNWLNDSQPIDDVIKAAIAHLWFVTIHPFDDGNGRIARAIGDLQLAKADKSKQRFYSMSAQIQKERNAYYHILEHTQKGNLDITEWLEWFLNCLDRSMEHTEQTIIKILKRNYFWEAHRDLEFNLRQKKMLQVLLDNFFGKLSVSKWALMTKTSTDTALRDIQGLLKMDILKQDGAGRNISYQLKEHQKY